MRARQSGPGRKGEKGMALIFALIALSVIAGFTVVLLESVHQQKRMSDHRNQRLMALEVAQGAMDLGVAKLRKGDTAVEVSLALGFDPGSWSDGSGDVTATLASNGLPDFGEDGVDIDKATEYESLFPGSSWFVSATRDADKDLTTLVATASHEGNLRRIRFTVRVSPPEPPEVKPFQYASYAGYAGADATPMTLLGSAQTDSYNSGSGAYSDANKSNNGNMGSNRGITMGGDAVINGEISVAGDYGLTMTGNAVVTGGAHVKDENVTVSDNATIGGSGIDGDATSQSLPPVEDRSADFAANNDNALIGMTQITGGGTLPPGKYYFDKFTLSGNEELTIQAPSEIYVIGQFKTSGNAVIWVSGADDTNRVEMYVASGASITGNGILSNGTQSKPQDFMIYSHGTAELKVTGNGNLYAGVYAPNATVKIAGNGDIYGSFIGKNIIMEGNAKIHFDESMTNIVPGYLEELLPEDSTDPWQVSVFVWEELR